MKETPADRLKALREKRFDTAKAAAEAFGWNEVTYRAHEAGTRNMPVSTARKYALAFQTTAAYILGMSSGEQLPAYNHLVSVPVIAKASAGAFRYDEGTEIEGIEVPAVPRQGIPANVQYALQIDGPSVNLRIPDGAFAICAPLEYVPGGAKHGQLVHVVRERAGLHEVTVKEIHYTRTGAVLMPCSNDQRYQEAIALDAPEDGTTVEIRGVVIGSFQPL